MFVPKIHPPLKGVQHYPSSYYIGSDISGKAGEEVFGYFCAICLFLLHKIAASGDNVSCFFRFEPLLNGAVCGRIDTLCLR